MYAACKPSATGFTAWCSWVPLKGPDATREPAKDVWFEFGRTADDAMTRLKRSLPSVLEWKEQVI